MEADKEYDFVEIETKGTLKETLEQYNIGTNKYGNEGSLGTFGTHTVVEQMKVMRINKRKGNSTSSQDSGKESVSKASTEESSYGDSIDTNMMSTLDMSSVSGVTTVSSDGSKSGENSQRANKKVKFTPTKDVHQYQVPTGSLNKKVMDAAKKKRKKEELAKQIMDLQQHIDTCTDPYRKDTFTKFLNSLKRKRSMCIQVLL